MDNYQKNLLSLFASKKAKICIIGLGYVGLPLAISYAHEGFEVIGIDIDINKVRKINSGKSYINHIPSTKLSTFTQNKRLVATSEFNICKNVDAIIICVPTPLNKYREPNLNFIRGTLSSINDFLKKGQILSLESTTYPGTTKEEVLPKLKNKGFNVGKDFFLVYSPEREDPGNKEFTTANIPKIIGGITNNCRDVGLFLYKAIIKKVVPVKDTTTAEMTKLLENIHRAINIGLMNELKPLADKMEIDLYEVIEAAATKPFGFVPYYPGPGLGGHCIPIDPFYLTWKAREYGMHTRFIELAGEINSSMPTYVVDKISDALNKQGKPINKSNILILGLSYKKNVDDMRESPSIEIIKLLKSKGSNVSYSDPYFKEFPKLRNSNFRMKNVKINEKNLSNADAVILITDHDDFDYQLIKKFSSLIIDTRGKYIPSSKIIRA